MLVSILRFSSQTLYPSPLRFSLPPIKPDDGHWSSFSSSPYPHAVVHQLRFSLPPIKPSDCHWPSFSNSPYPHTVVHQLYFSPPPLFLKEIYVFFFPFLFLLSLPRSSFSFIYSTKYYAFF